MRTPLQLPLPDALLRALHRFGAGLRRMETQCVLLSVLALGLLCIAILFGFDRIGDTPAPARWLLALPPGLAAIGALAFLSWRWLVLPPSLPTLALRVQRHHPHLGDRLQGIVELACHPDAAGSRVMAEAAIRQVSAEALRVDMSVALPYALRRRALLLFAAALVPVLGLVTLAPAALVTTAQRLFLPWRAVPRTLLVRLDGLPQQRIVGLNEPVELTAQVHARGWWRPRTAVARLNAQRPWRTPLAGRDLRLALPGQTQAVDVRIRVGDARGIVRLLPLPAPAVTGLVARVTAPAYLQRPGWTVAADGALRVPAGGSVRVTAFANRALAEVSAQPDSVPLQLDGARVDMGPVDVPEDREWRLAWRDAHGIGPEHPLRLRALATVDTPPFVSAEPTPRAQAALEDEPLLFPFRAGDDFGVRDMHFQWRVEADGIPPGEWQRMLLARGGPAAVELTHDLALTPASFGAAEGETLALRAETADYFPGRPPAYSQEHRVRVLTAEEHAEKIRRGLDGMRNAVEDLLRRQEATREGTEEIADRPDAELAASDSDRDVRDRGEGQSAHREDMEDLAERMAELTQEAMKNPTLDDRQVADMAAAAVAMRESAEGSMAEAKEALAQAGASPQPPQRRPALDEALAAQRRAVRELQELQERMNEQAEQMLAQSFLNRLRTAATRQRSFLGALTGDAPALAGVAPRDLPREAGAQRVATAADVKTESQTVRYIQDDLAGFYNRTRRPVYGEIYSNMLAEAVTEQVGKLAELVEANLIFRGADAADGLAARFDTWAELLAEDRQQAQASAGQGEGIPINPEDLAILMRLERARRAEESLRAGTRAAHERRAGPRYAQSSADLARRQYDLARELQPLERTASNDKLAFLLEKIVGEMQNVTVLLRLPRTDADTIAIQTEIIELLSSAMSESMQQGAAGASAAAMLQAMGLMPSAMGFAGGEGALPPGEAPGGRADGTGDAARRVERATGRGTTAVPTEYRRAVQEYRHALERSTP
jgi:hypothetical protein